MNGPTNDWLAAANRLQTILTAELVEPSVLSFLQENRDQPWVLACSGGADSTCLALACQGWFKDPPPSLALAHFNHGLRGAESEEDQSFVEDMAQGLGLRFELGRGQPTSERPSEAELREKRHSFLSKVCEGLGSKVILFGHHLDDVAETMVMRLTRGSGSEGLAAPRPTRRVRGIWRIRPLLSLSKIKIREALVESGITWREDSSNQESIPFRNRVRHEALPAIMKASPTEALVGFARSRALLQEDHDALDLMSDKILGKVTLSDGSLNARTLPALPPAILRRTLRKWLMHADAADALSARAFDDLLTAVGTNRETKVSLARNRWVTVSEAKVNIVGESEPGLNWGPCSLPSAGSLVLPDAAVLRVSGSLDGDEARSAIDRSSVDEASETFLDADSIGGSLQVRTWTPGDRYTPLGSPGSRKLQDLFTDRKVPASRRRRLPIVLSRESRIAWCPGLPPAEECRVTDDSRKVLRLTYFQSQTSCE